MKRLFFLLLGSALLCSSAIAADNRLPGKKATKVGMLTAYYAAETFELNNNVYQKGQLVCDTNDTLNKIEEADEANYKFVLGEGCEIGCDFQLPKAKVYTKTYEMNELTTENVGSEAVFKSEDGLTARIFLADFNGHECRSYGGKEVYKTVTKALWESYVLSFQMKVPGSDDIYIFEDFVEEVNGHLLLYVDNSSTENIIYGYIADMWINPADWEAPSAFDKYGLLLTDLWENADMPDSASVAYIAALDALYLNGRLYYRSQQ